MRMSHLRAARRKEEIAYAKARKALRYHMTIGPFETEDGPKVQTKIGGAVRPTIPRGSWNQ